MRTLRLLAVGACVAGLGTLGPTAAASAYPAANPAITYTTATAWYFPGPVPGYGTFTETDSLMVMNADGTNQTAVWTRDYSQAQFFASIANPRWSPDGKHILFLYRPVLRGPVSNVMEVDVAVVKGKVKGTNVRTIVDLSAQGRHVVAIDWSPLGNEIAYVSSDIASSYDCLLCTRSLDTHGNPVGSARTVYAFPSGISGGVTYSPDGSRFATTLTDLTMAAGTIGRQWIAVIDRSGSATNLATNLFWFVDQPCWSNPGENLLFFRAGTSGGVRGAYTLDMSVPGAAPVQTVNTSLSSAGDFSPDNSKAVVGIYPESFASYDFASGTLTPIAYGGTSGEFFTWFGGTDWRP